MRLVLDLTGYYVSEKGRRCDGGERHGLPQLVVHSPPRPPSPDSVVLSPEEHRRSSVFSPEVAVVVPRAVREARPPPDDLAVVEAGERV